MKHSQNKPHRREPYHYDASGAQYIACMDCINTAGDFEASMSNVEALSGASGDELEALSDKAKEMGATTKFTAGESADALSYMALAGWNTQSMLEGISPVLNLAAAANMDLAQASDIVTDYLTAFGLKASDTTHFVDVMAYAMAHSNTDVIQLGEAYKACASTATSLGYSVEETTAVLATMANAGVKGGEAGTALNAIFTRLATNTKKCGDELANYGVNIYDAQGNMQSLSSILTGIAGVWGDLTDQEQANLAKTIAGTNQYSKLQTIMAGCSEAAAEGGQSFSDYTEALNNCAGSADKMAGTMLDNMNGRLVLMQSAADGLKIAIGEDLTPTMSGLYDVGAQVLGWMQGFVEENPGVIKGIAAGTVTLGGLAGAITAVNAALKLSKVLAPTLTTVAPVLGTAALAAGGVAAVVALLSSAANDTVPSVQELTTAAQNVGSAMKEAGTDYDTTLSSMEATASVADQYIGKLEAIEAATGGNTAGNTEYHNTLARLSALVPSLADDIDLETDSIKGGTEALRQHTDAYVADAKAQARQDYLNTLYEKYRDVLSESAENEVKLNAAKAKVEKSNAGMVTSYDKLLATLGMTDEQFKLTYGTVQDLPWRTMSEDVQQLRSEYLSYSADLVTARREVENYTEAMAQDQEAVDAAQTEYQEAAAAINGMKSAQSTIQGFVDGAEGMLPRVQTVFSKIASAASTALAGAGGSYSGNIPGYAVGTESAAPGFAIVGENGPELVYFNGGETVLTAPETRAAFDEAQQFTQIVSKNALDFAAIQQAAGLSEDSMQTLCHDWTVYNEYEALTANTAAPAEVVPASSFTPSDFTPSEGSPISINFAPVYNFSGVSDTQQFESLLTSHDNDMREYILDVVEEAEHDKFRRAYA